MGFLKDPRFLAIPVAVVVWVAATQGMELDPTAVTPAVVGVATFIIGLFTKKPGSA